MDQSGNNRVESVDLLRGIVMIFMLLDHTREFTHFDVLNFDPSDPARTNVPLYFTRWITHFCAPVFVFLAGTSAYLQLARGKSKSELSKFLFTRGLWLVVLEFTVIRVIMWFNVDFHFAAMFEVIWVIGVAMIILSGALWLPLRIIAIGAIAMIALHNLLDGIQVRPSVPAGLGDAIWLILHQPGLIFFTPKHYALVAYPLIPWIGVLLAGFAFGAIYRMESTRRTRILVGLGIGMIAAFIIIRAINYYGDPRPWSEQRSAVYTALSFLNVSKYPPSLLFLLMTLGPPMLALAWFEKPARDRLSRIFIIFGRVPLFFWLVQWIVTHGLAVMVTYIAGQPLAWQFATILERPTPNPGNLGFPLWVTYLLWLIGIVMLYPLCRWFAGVKQRRKDWRLSYL